MFCVWLTDREQATARRGREFLGREFGDLPSHRGLSRPVPGHRSDEFAHGGAYENSGQTDIRAGGRMMLCAEITAAAMGLRVVRALMEELPPRWPGGMAVARTPFRRRILRGWISYLRKCGEWQATAPITFAGWSLWPSQLKTNRTCLTSGSLAGHGPAQPLCCCCGKNGGQLHFAILSGRQDEALVL